MIRVARSTRSGGRRSGPRRGTRSSRGILSLVWCVRGVPFIALAQRSGVPVRLCESRVSRVDGVRGLGDGVTPTLSVRRR